MAAEQLTPKGMAAEQLTPKGMAAELPPLLLLTYTNFPLKQHANLSSLIKNEIFLPVIVVVILRINTIEQYIGERVHQDQWQLSETCGEKLP